MRSTALCAAILAAGVGGLAHAQLVVSNDGAANSNIWYIDLATNNATSIYSGADALAWGMTYSESSNTLYWNNGGTLFSSQFSQGGLTPSSVALTLDGATTNFVGLAWWQGRLVGTRNIGTEGVYDINPITGEATLINTYASAFDFGGLDSDGTTLYGISDSAPAGGPGRGLYSIDVGTGIPSFIAGSPAGDTDIDGLAIGNNRAYWVNDRGDQDIFVYNLLTNSFEASIANPILGTGIFSAGAYIVPTPGAAALMGLGGFAALRRRR